MNKHTPELNALIKLYNYSSLKCLTCGENECEKLGCVIYGARIAIERATGQSIEEVLCNTQKS